MKQLFLFVFTIHFIQNTHAQKFENLAPTPPMGWNSWNTFQTNINEALVKETADKMVSSGMLNAGYTYLVLDDGWMAKERDADGNLVADPIKFPQGIKHVADYVHSKGLKFGLYNCAGTKTCAGYPGTRGYEYNDARWYAKNDVDYLKYDWCNTDGINAKEAYTTMSNALKLAGRKTLFSLCEWGDNKPWEWAKEVGQMWRISGDISTCFDCIESHGTWNSWGVTYIIDMRKNIRQYAGPNHFNDFDMLEVGNGMQVNEDRAHFSMWCMLASPLIAGNDVRSMSKQTIDILTNKQALAINQDSLGIQAFKYAEKDSVQTWYKPLQHGDWAVCYLNTSASNKPINIDYKNVVIEDSVAKRTLNTTTTKYILHNIWAAEKDMPLNKPTNIVVPKHDVVMYRIVKV